MKQIALIALCMAAAAGAAAQQRADTLIIELGSNSKVIIFVDDREDLKSLQQFDFNEMIREINQRIEASGSMAELRITDSTGQRFIKDTLISREPEGSEGAAKSAQETPAAAQPNPPSIIHKMMNTKDLAAGDTAPNGQKRKPDYRTSRLSSTYISGDFGLNNWMTDGKLPSGKGMPHTVKPAGSWYVGARVVRNTAIGGAVFLKLGTSITWYNWKLENRAVRIEESAQELRFVEVPDIKGLKSKLSALHLNLECIPTLNFAYGRVRLEDPELRRRRYTRHVRPNGIRIGIGGYAGYRLDSWTKHQYRDANGDKKTDRVGGTYHLNNLRYGARLELGFDYQWALFFNYDLNTVFTDNRGPKLNAASFGVTVDL